jgi:D-alanyl-D-alanine carboxypeptidase
MRRRWIFLTLIAALGIAAVALTVHGPPGASEPAVARGEGDGTSPRVPADSGTAAPDGPEPAAPEPPPYFLAWTPGGLPLDLRAQVRTVRGLTSTVVVAGDTRWLTRSIGADGDVIDDPEPPFAIPIDAFAVNPLEIAPFLPSSVRGDVVDALARGQGVLGTRSAEVRRLGMGGTLEFGDRSVRIGAVVPEELIGWSEMLVSREVGARLGIVDDRYLWAFPRERQSLDIFERLVRPLVPANEPIRVEGPGDTPYMRVANGVNPPVVLKQAFGEFAAALDPADPGFFRIDPAWVAANLVTRTVPLLGTLTCHRRFMEDLVRAMRRVQREGLASAIHSTAGCFNARTVARSPTNPPSFHAYGAAVDINAPENALGAVPTMDRRVVAIFEDLGFNWGGDFLIPDGMHFEYGGGPLAGES